MVDLLRLLDYPSDYVLVLTHLPKKEGDPVSERVDIMDKKALNRRLARSYLVELIDRARIVCGLTPDVARCPRGSTPRMSTSTEIDVFC